MNMDLSTAINFPLTESERRGIGKARLLLTDRGIGKDMAPHAMRIGFDVVVYDGSEDCFVRPITAAVNTFLASDDLHAAFNTRCLGRGIPVLYPFDMGWGTAVVVATKCSTPLTDIEIRTDNYDTDVRSHIGRYVSFWTRQTPADLLRNDNPACSDALTLGMSIRVLIDLANGKPVRLFPDMYFALCTPEGGI